MQFGTRKELENEISSISAILSNPNNIWSDRVEAVSLELNLSHHGGGGWGGLHIYMLSTATIQGFQSQ